MKRIVLLISFVFALALCASAQTYINFNDMPMATTPSPMPDLYPSGVSLYWDNFAYVTPGAWDKAGPGFWVGPYAGDVVFIGGPLCPLALPTPCGASIKMNPIPATPTALPSFTPVSMTLSAGWSANHVIINAFNKGTWVGSITLSLTTTPHIYPLPPTWKDITQLTFTPELTSNHAVYPQGSMVMYNFILMKH